MDELERVQEEEEEEISLFEIATAILSHRRGAVIGGFLGAFLAVAPIISSPPVYAGSASFVPPTGDPARSQLANLAGQLGVGIPLNASATTDFYLRLLSSRELLATVVRDTISVTERRGVRTTFLDLMEVKGSSSRQREEEGVKILKGIMTTVGAKNTGVVEIVVLTEWPSVSLALISGLVKGVNDYHLHTRQGQAGAERKFIEGRLEIARSELRASEDRMQRFQVSNRMQASPELGFERDRLNRDLLLKQQVYTLLVQSLEDARIREVRDTPAITVLESPAVRSRAEPRGRLKRAALGVAVGGVLGLIVAFLLAWLRRSRQSSDPRAIEFYELVRDFRREVSAGLHRLRGAGRRSASER